MTPYRAAAREYYRLGWSPIPLPHESKSPVPNHPNEFTGASGEYVSEKQLSVWLSARGRAQAGNLSYAPGNIALRLPRGVLGIDVDAYGKKAGATTLLEAERVWGTLPDTWRSSSRGAAGDEVSGIYLYRIPEGLSWPGQLPQGGGVELIRWDHRYAIVEPSVHDKTKAIYRWYAPGSVAPAEEEVPSPHELAELPASWVDGLTSGAAWTERPVDEEMTPRDIQDWLMSRPAPEGEPCSVMRSVRAGAERRLRAAGDEGGAHQAAVDGAWSILKEAARGHAGVVGALGALRKVFLVAVGGRRARNGEAKREWARAVGRGIRKVSAEEEGQEATEDPCAALGPTEPPVAGRVGGKGGSKGMDWRTDDIGNASRLIRVMENRARWVPGADCWYIWDEERGVWKVDADGQVERWAVKAVDLMSDEAAYIEDEKVREGFLKFARSSGNAGRLTAAVQVARGRKGITIGAEAFDGNERLLCCANGTVELGVDGWRLRPWDREEFMSQSTKVRAVAGAKSLVWDGFLELVLPDEELRCWVQRLVGYSLLGANPERLLVAVVGPTSTGKSTFAEAVMRALGQYSGVMPASVLRDNQDDKPRPDLLTALPKRLIIAEELSAAQHLHPDQIKRLTGNVAARVRGMRSNVFVERLPAFTPWLVTNETPSIEGGDDAVRRRLVVVPFDQQVERGKEDTQMRFRLAAPAVTEAILAWALEGYRLWTAGTGGRLSRVPSGALAVNQKFAKEMSEFNHFVNDVLDFNEDWWEVPSRLYEVYQMWCEQNGMQKGGPNGILTNTMFGRRLNGIGIQKGYKYIDGKKVDVRTGARIVDKWNAV